MQEKVQNKAELYLKQRKNDLYDKVLLLKAKLNKNIVEIENIDLKIKEIDKKVDIAMEVFSPRKQINDFTRDEIHDLSDKKKNLININDEIINEINECNSDISKLDDAISDLEKYLVKEIQESNSIDEENKFNGITGKSILETQELERQRIARELHDSPVQILTNCIHKTELCSKVIDIDPVRAKLELEILNNTIRNTINEMRNIIFDLRPMSFDDLGFEISLERIINKIQIDSKMNIEITYVGDKKEISRIVGLTIIRIVQESCNNSLKYSHGKNIKIIFTYENESIKLKIQDDGEGFDTKNIKSGFGLSIMRERVYLLSGSIDIKSGKSGTVIEVDLPLNGGSGDEH